MDSVLEWVKDIFSIFGAFIAVFLGLYKLVRHLGTSSAQPPTNSISGIVLRISLKTETLLRKFLELPLHPPLMIADNPRSDIIRNYNIQEYRYSYNINFTNKALAEGRLIFLAMGSLMVAVILVSVLALVFCIYVSIIFKIALALLLIGPIVVSSSVGMGAIAVSYYVPHVITIRDDGLIAVDKLITIPVNQFVDFTVTRKYFIFDVCEYKSPMRDEPYILCIVPLIFRLLKGNIPIERVVEGINEFIASHIRELGLSLFSQENTPHLMRDEPCRPDEVR